MKLWKIMFSFPISYDLFWKILRVVLIVIIGFPVINMFVRIIKKTLGNYGTEHLRMIIGNIVYYLGLILIAISVLNELGFQLSALLGAAGIAGIAIGFAAQTSMSNLISGLFLLSEGFITKDDLIKCGNVFGKIEAIDLFSVKVRTFDNQLIRIPSERLIKNDVSNVTYYPVRRSEIAIAVPSDQDLQHVLAMLNEVVSKNEHAVKKPAHSILITSLSSSAFHLNIRVWTEKSNFINIKQSLLPEIKEKLVAQNITPLYVIAK